MDWLNIHIPTVIRSPEFIGAEPVDRSTHIMLLAFCAGLENGGVIRDCAGWKDRKWQQLAAVTHDETRRQCELWHWQGDDLHVHHYPAEKEAEIKHLRTIGKSRTPAKQAAAKANGKNGGRPAKTQHETQHETQRKTQRENPTKTEQEPNKKPIERKGIGIGKEGEVEARARAAAAAEKLIDAHPRPSKNRAALEAAHHALTLDPFETILDGVTAYAAAVAAWPTDEQIAYTMTAAKFFEGIHWRTDPQEWHSRRQAKKNLNGTRPSVDIGGRKPKFWGDDAPPLPSTNEPEFD